MDQACYSICKFLHHHTDQARYGHKEGSGFIKEQLMVLCVVCVGVVLLKIKD